MNKLGLISIAFILASLCCPIFCSNETQDDIYKQAFQSFKLKYNKEYADQDEEAHRFEIFRKNIANEDAKSKGDRTLKVRLPPFLDLLTQELCGLLENRMPINKPEALSYYRQSQERIRGIKLPEEIDLRRLGFPKAKNQSPCGSCWAFSLVNLLEFNVAHMAQKGLGIYRNLSSQNILGCTSRYHSCLGIMSKGARIEAFDAVNAFGGLMSENDYPLEISNETLKIFEKCKFNPLGVVPFTKIKNVVHLNFEGDEKSLKRTIFNFGAVYASIYAGTDEERDFVDFDFSGGQVFFKPEFGSGKDPNHAINIIGYGMEKEIKYWLCSSSWGKDFGENGIFKIRMVENYCNILSRISIPSFEF